MTAWLAVGGSLLVGFLVASLIGDSWQIHCDCNQMRQYVDKESISQVTGNSTRTRPSYTPSSTEEYAAKNAASLGYNATSLETLKPTCTFWTDPNLPFQETLMQYREELANYTRKVDAFEPIADLRQSLWENHDVCETLRLDPGGLNAMFPSQQLSSGSSFGGIEPILPPMRHPNFCVYPQQRGKYLMDMSYMVHDFEAMCRRLKPTSKMILVDMGASLEFHAAGTQPAMYILNLYQKFGFHFDHIYAFEIKTIPPKDVFAKVPEKLRAAYHWINIGVDSDPQSPNNPLKMILDNYNDDDFVVIKLDIDTASIEVPLALQLLEHERYSTLIDQFYFEHHVFLSELAPDWGPSMKGSLMESMKLFSTLREKGIAAHSWV